MLTASRSYRCKDNSLFYIDFFNDEVTAHLRTERNGPFTILKAPEAGTPYVGEGYSLSRGPGGATIQVIRPGKQGMSCKG